MTNNGGSAPLSALEFEQRFPNIRQKIGHFGQVQVDKLMNWENNKQGTATFALGTTLTMTSEVYYADQKHQLEGFFGNIYTAIYEGTAVNGDFQIYPSRGTATTGTYAVMGGYDALNSVGWDGYWRGDITRLAGTSSQSIVFQARWGWIDNTLGTITHNLTIEHRT